MFQQVTANRFQDVVCSRRQKFHSHWHSSVCGCNRLQGFGFWVMTASAKPL